MSSTSQLALDRKACLLLAMKDQGARCFWCDGPIVIASAIDTSLTFLKWNHCSVSFLNAGAVITLGIASADHVIPQWMGGQTTRENIVAACRACNEDRGQLHSPSWFMIDVSGFNHWVDWKREEKRRQRRREPPTRLTMSLRPLLEEAFGK